MPVRIAKLADAPQVVTLVSALLVELGRAEALPDEGALAACEHLIGTPDLGFVVVSEDEGVFDAICTVSMVHAIRTLGFHAVVQELYVAPEKRRGNLGRRVLQAVIDEARHRGSRSIELTTPSVDRGALHFYEEFGFTRGGPRVALRLD